MKKGEYKIPFNRGNQLDYPSGDYPQYPETRIEWVDNHEFDDTLTLKGYGRGRSSVTFEMERTNGKTVSVFVSDFTAMAREMIRGKISGRFTFQKKGQNYGCKLSTCGRGA